MDAAPSLPRRGRDKESTRGVRWPTASIHILLIAALLLQIRYEQSRLFRAARAVLRHDIDQRGLDILCHALGVAADIEVRAVGDPTPQIAANLAHTILHVDLLIAIARPRERQTRE